MCFGGNRVLSKVYKGVKYIHCSQAVAEMPAKRVLPTPCREGIGLAQEVQKMIPDLRDDTASHPQPGKLRLSPEAIEGRLRRVFTPNVKGEFKVSAAIVQQWKCKKSRKSLEKIFQSVGFNTDMGFQTYPQNVLVRNGFTFYSWPFLTY